jgi:hypothetical protein
MSKQIAAPDFTLSGLSVLTNGAWSERVSPGQFQQWVSGGYITSQTLVHWPMLAPQPIMAGSFTSPGGYQPNVVPALLQSNVPFVHRGEVHCSDGAVLDHCVRCGEPASQFRKRKLEKQNPVALVGIVFGIIGLAIMSAILNKRISVHVGLCEQHQARQRKQTVAGIGVALAGLVGFFAMIQFGDSESSVVCGFGLLLLGIATGSFVGKFGQSNPKLKELTDNVAKLGKVQVAVQQRLPHVVG